MTFLSERRCDLAAMSRRHLFTTFGVGKRISSILEWLNVIFGFIEGENEMAQTKNTYIDPGIQSFDKTMNNTTLKLIVLNCGLSIVVC